MKLWFYTAGLRHALLLAGFSLTMLGLTGCQHTLKAPTLNSALPPQQVVSTQFSITGKIGVRTLQQNGSAFYAWTQINDHFAIDLTGALGIGQTHIEGVPGKVTLVSAKTGTLYADSPEALLYKATGWQAPISYLPSWIQAKPAAANARTQYDEQQRLSWLEEDDWQVQFSYQDNAQLPNKLTMRQALPSGENRVILTIQSRTDAMQ